MSGNTTAVATSSSFGGWDLSSFQNDPDVKTQLFSLLYFLSLVIVLWIGSRSIVLWKIYHLSTPGVAIIIGALLSVITSTYGYTDIANNFDADFFFWYLLPPLIFQAGFDQDRSHFFSNWFAITIFANIGTCISALFFGYGLYFAGSFHFSLSLSLMECLAFGALISSTDPVSTLAVFADLKVDPSLSAIVYGASTIDDAVSIILYKIFLSILAKKKMSVNVGLGATVYLLVSLLASMSIGSLIGGIAAYLYKLNKIRENKNMIICYVIPLIYISYLSCNVLELSGIISCMFAAISFRYCLEIGGIISMSDKESLLLNLSVLSRFIETFVFFCIGMSLARRLISSSKHIDAKFVCWSILLTILSRAAQIYPLSYVTNVYNGAMRFYCCYSVSETVTPSEDGSTNEIEAMELDAASTDDESTTSKVAKPLYININAQHILMLAGLRGPIAYAAAEMFPKNLGSAENIYFATSFIVLTNLFICGALTQAAIDFFKIERERDKHENDKTQTAPCTDHLSTDYINGSNYILKKRLNPSKHIRRNDDSDAMESGEKSSESYGFESNPGSIRNSSDKMNFPNPVLESHEARNNSFGSPLDIESGILSKCHREKVPSSSSSGDSKHSEPSKFSEGDSELLGMEEMLPKQPNVKFRGEDKMSAFRSATEKKNYRINSPRSEEDFHRVRYKAGKGVFSRWFKLFEDNVVVPIYVVWHPPPPPPPPIELRIFFNTPRPHSSSSAIAVI